MTNDVTRSLDIARTCGAVACAYTNACTRVGRWRRGGQRYSPSALRQLQCCDGCTWEGEGEGGREDRCACVCLLVYACVYEKGVLPLPLPRVSLIHFHYIFAIGALRDTLYLTSNRALRASRCNFAGSFFLPFLLATFVPISIARPSASTTRDRFPGWENSTSSLAEFIFTDDDLFLNNVNFFRVKGNGLIVKLKKGSIKNLKSLHTLFLCTYMWNIR